MRSGDAARGFTDLRGRSWAFNDLDSHSGYNLTRHELVRRGETRGFFSHVIAAGSHQRALRMVAAGEVDASAIDSQVLAIELRDHRELAEAIQVIETLGPSTIQPLVVAASLPESLKSDMREIVLTMHRGSAACEMLARGFIERFVPVADANYDDIRGMLQACEANSFLTLR